MKKLLVLVLVLSSVAVGYAQVQVALGIKGGVNLSKLDTDYDAGNITAFHGGAFALFKLTKIGIQPEVLFSQQGSSIDDVSLDKGDLKTSYLAIPVMLKLYLIGGLNVQAGPQFGFLTAAEFDGKDAKDDLKNSDISANLGLGWDLPFGLTIDARYNLGLSDIKADGSNFEGSFKSRTIQVSLGYKIFKLGK
ncbi:MAG: PorT family protein [Cyclobacteriaceae bacterium]|nr:MAG: PorT family protein [Cyclobacteriaceae bacterium]